MKKSEICWDVETLRYETFPNITTGYLGSNLFVLAFLKKPFYYLRRLACTWDERSLRRFVLPRVRESCGYCPQIEISLELFLRMWKNNDVMFDYMQDLKIVIPPESDLEMDTSGYPPLALSSLEVVSNIGMPEWIGLIDIHQLKHVSPNYIFPESLPEVQFPDDLLDIPRSRTFTVRNARISHVKKG